MDLRPSPSPFLLDDLALPSDRKKEEEEVPLPSTLTPSFPPREEG